MHCIFWLDQKLISGFFLVFFKPIRDVQTLPSLGNQSHSHNTVLMIEGPFLGKKAPFVDAGWVVVYEEMQISYTATWLCTEEMEGRGISFLM